MNWTIVILGIVFVLFLYLKFKDNITTPNTRLDFMPILYALGLAGIFWFLTPLFFPRFWGSYYGSDLFWPSVIAMIFCLYMWSQKYVLFIFLFFAILFLVLYNFSKGNGFTSDNGAYSPQVVVWHKQTPTDSVVIYSGPTNIRIKPIPTWGQIRISPQCEQTVSVNSKGWRSGEVLRGCSGGEIKFPQAFDKWIDIRSI